MRLSAIVWLAALNLCFAAQAQESAPPRPLELRVTAAHEQPIRLCAVNIDAQIFGAEAITEMELKFCNPNDRVLEGELAFPLLEGQRMVGMALDFDGRLREAVPVEKAKGQEIFEEVVRGRVDPALLEVTAGNQFKLRVYPLPARGERRVLLRYSETLAPAGAGRTYRLPLALATALDGFRLRLRVYGAATAPTLRGLGLPDVGFTQNGETHELHLSREQFLGSGVLEVGIKTGSAPLLATQRLEGRNYFVAEVPLPAGAAKSAPRRLPKTIALFWDASGSSQDADEARILGLLDAYFRALGSLRVSLFRFRDVVEPGEVFEVRGGEWRRLREAIERTPRDGATRLGALRDVPEADEVLLVSDGLSNYGVRRLPRFDRPVFAMTATAGADQRALAQIAGASGAVLDLLGLKPEEALALLTRSAPRLLSLEGSGLAEIALASPLAAQGRWRVAGQYLPGSKVFALVRDAAGREFRVPLSLPSEPASGGQAARLWAQMRIAALEAEPALHRAAIRRLGETFGLATRETSLIVLDRIEDYLRHDIVPPAELRAEYDRLQAVSRGKFEGQRMEKIERVAREFAAKVAWWERDFPKGERIKIAEESKAGAVGLGAALADAAPPRAFAAPPSPAAPAPLRSRLLEESVRAEAPLAKRAGKPGESERGRVAGISVQAWRADAPYLGRLREAAGAELYAIYLDERPSWRRSSAFYLDVADHLQERGQPALARRVLSNLAEMEIENRQLLRVLAYRLIQFGESGLATPILESVRELAPNEPQSQRDLALALWATGEHQAALERFWEVVERPWAGRFPEIELVAIEELNALLVTAPRPLDVTRIDRRFLKNLPVDLRVVLAWDTDNTDLDLWVTDPNGERAFYGNRLTYQGGRMSPDFTGGYGPEVFALKKAKPGTYRVEVKFYGQRQQVVTGATTLALRLQTGFGTPSQTEKMIGMRLSKAGEGIFVGEFVVPGE
ncbi:hypothetical protein BURK2_03937 [Burkholderiales bacterium]|nr:hypothetical protein BURK2_03937 [Burkholderiales bacterium]